MIKSLFTHEFVISVLLLDSLYLGQLGHPGILKGSDAPVSNSSLSSSEISKYQFSPSSDRDAEAAKALTDRDIVRWFGVTVRHLDCLFPDES